jgi:hypothetical protein
MFNVLDDFFEDDFSLGFGKPTLIYYNTPHTQDMNPAYWQKQMPKDGEEDKFDIYRATCRSVGVSKNDVSVKINGNYINVGGKTTTNGIDYDFACSLPVAETIIENIDKILYETINGITYIYVYVKKSKGKNIEITKMN